MALEDMLVGRVFTVLGGGGFVGRRVVERLRAGGARVYSPDRDDPALFSQPLGNVIYAAGLTADYLTRPFDTVEAHVGLLARVLQQCQWESLVYLSSTRLYDSRGAVEASESLELHLDPAQPRHLYDFSKALGESLCHVIGQGRARIARLACVYEGMSDTDGFLSSLLRQAAMAARMGKMQLEVDTSASFLRDYVHVSDVVDGLICIALQGQHVVYNVASGRNVSNADLFAYILQRWGCQVIAKSPHKEVFVPRISIDRMRVDFDWRPKDVFDVLDTCSEA